MVTDSVTAGPTEWVTLPDVADKSDVSISKVNQMVRDGALLAVKRDGVRGCPLNWWPTAPFSSTSLAS